MVRVRYEDGTVKVSGCISRLKVICMPKYAEGDKLYFR